VAEIAWTGEAESNLLTIYEYVAHDSPAIAGRIIRELVDSAERLSEFPLSGRSVEELKEQGVRELVVAPYRIAYKVTDQTVAILKVWHGKRLLRPEDFLT
jgi:toxin ParE1/3/4